MSLKDFWKKEEYHKKYNITYSSFSNYISGRSNLYTQTGPKPGSAAEKTKKMRHHQKKDTPSHKVEPVTAEQTTGSHRISQHWNTLAQGDNYATRQLRYELYEKKQTREEVRYHAMQCSFRHPYTCPDQAKYRKIWWKKLGLRRYCRLVGADKDWMQDKLDLLRECGKTFGPHEVRYEGPRLCNKKGTSPMLQELSDAGKTAAARKRSRMKRAIERFRLI